MRTIDEVSLLKLDTIDEECDKMVFFENMVCGRGGGKPKLPFVIKRIFYMYGSDMGIVRGNHANRNSEFILINVRGSSKVRVRDGVEDKVYCLSKPDMGLYIPKMIWKEMYDFSEDSVLLCFSSENYDPVEYIKNFDEYVKENGAGIK